MIVVVEIVVDEVCSYLKSLKLLHHGQINTAQILVGQLQNQMLDINKLPEKESLVDEPARPLQIENSNALADCEITAIGEEESRVVVLNLNAQF